MPRSFWPSAATLACLTFLGSSFAAGQAPAQVDVTLFGWSDQHVTTDGDGRHVEPAIDAMNALPGTAYPPRIGGKVERPAFVIGCGDITEWPTRAAAKTYEELVTRRLKFPSYDVIGNHDEGGKVPSETIKRWIAARHGGLSYTFDQGGVHFVVVYSKFDENLDNPAQPLAREALDFLRGNLAKTARDKPVVVATHLCFDAITNRDELLAAFGGARVVLVLGGHYHKSKVDRAGGVPFVQLPSPAANGQKQVTVIRITAERVLAVPYDYQQKRWIESPGQALDEPLRKPAAEKR